MNSLCQLFFTCLILFLCIHLVIRFLFSVFSSFHYPYFYQEFDVSGKRKPQIEDWLDQYLIDGGFADIQKHEQKVQMWKQQSEDQINRSLFKNVRRRRYEQVLDDVHGYHFVFVRDQIRYRQRNYVKTAYRVSVNDKVWYCSYTYIENRYRQLAQIDFACTLSAWNCKNQRKLATRELREKVMKRDHYICQLCGKYMPDEVGLQVDHIIPVSKGGKTVMSNLQVLCSKCNGSKSNKM